MMFTRIVKMTFRPETIPTFLNNFEEVKERIRSFDGCVFLELYQDRQRLEVFLPTVGGNQKPIWKPIATVNCSRRFGDKQSRCFKKKRQHGA